MSGKRKFQIAPNSDNEKKLKVDDLEVTGSTDLQDVSVTSLTNTGASDLTGDVSVTGSQYVNGAFTVGWPLVYPNNRMSIFNNDTPGDPVLLMTQSTGTLLTRLEGKDGSDLRLDASSSGLQYVLRTDHGGLAMADYKSANPSFVLTAADGVAINKNGTSDRQLEVVDGANPQLRLTQSGGTNYVDIQADNNGNCNFVLGNPGVIDFGTYGWRMGASNPVFPSYESLVISSQYWEGVIPATTVAADITLYRVGEAVQMHIGAVISSGITTVAGPMSVGASGAYALPVAWRPTSETEIPCTARYANQISMGILRITTAGAIDLFMAEDDTGLGQMITRQNWPATTPTSYSFGVEGQVLHYSLVV